MDFRAGGANLKTQVIVSGKQSTRAKYVRAGLLNGAARGRTDMERLTYFDSGKWRLKIGDTEYSGEAVARLAAYEDTGLEPEDIISAADMAKITCALHEFNVYKKLDSLARLRELAQADRDGRCVVLPAKIHDKLYYLTGADDQA